MEALTEAQLLKKLSGRVKSLGFWEWKGWLGSHLTSWTAWYALGNWFILITYKDDYKSDTNSFMFSGQPPPSLGTGLVRFEVVTPPFRVSGSPLDTRLFIKGCEGEQNRKKETDCCPKEICVTLIQPKGWPSPPKELLRTRTKKNHACCGDPTPASLGVTDEQQTHLFTGLY